MVSIKEIGKQLVESKFDVTRVALNQVFPKVILRSQLSPDVETAPFAPGAPQPPSPGGFNLMALVKPEIELSTPTGPYIVAPWGRPAANYWPFLASAIVGGASFAGAASLGVPFKYRAPLSLALVIGTYFLTK